MQFINKGEGFHDFIANVLVNKVAPPFLFVGAGVSMPAHLPSWSDLIGSCIRQAFGDAISVKNLANLHQVELGSTWLIDAALQRAKKEEYELLHEAVWGKSPQDIRPAPLHYLIVKYAKIMNTPIYTTNYDDLLEQAAGEMGYSPTIYSDKALRKNANLNRFCIVYVHGKLPQKKERYAKRKKAVASKISYYDEYNNTSTQIKSFQEKLQKSSCIFIGCSLTDDNINRCLFEASKGSKNRHYWFTRLAAKNSFEKDIHHELWNHLHVTPIYCQNKGFHEIPTAFRRALTHLEHKASPIDYFDDAATFNFFNKKFEKLLNSEYVKKCAGPYDKVELDLYLDITEKKDRTVVMERVWSSGSNFTDFKKKIQRSFTLPMDLSSDFFIYDMNKTSISVIETMDSLSIHQFVRKEDLVIPKDQIPTKAENSSECPRSWSFLSFPVFSHHTGRAAAIFVLKFTNKNNHLVEQTSPSKDYHTNLYYDIINLGEFFTEQFNT